MRFLFAALLLVLALSVRPAMADDPLPTEIHGKVLFISDSVTGPWFLRGVTFYGANLTPANNWGSSAFTWGASNEVYGGLVTFRPGGTGSRITEIQLCDGAGNCHSELYAQPGLWQWNAERSTQKHCWYSNNPSTGCILLVDSTNSLVQIQNLGVQPGLAIYPIPRTMTKDSDAWGTVLLGSEAATLANDGGAMKRYAKVEVRADNITAGAPGQVLPEAYTLKIVEAPQLGAGATVVSGKRAGAYIGGHTHTDGVRLLDPGALPVCDVSNRGLLRYQEGSEGVADSLLMCAKLATESYAWVQK